jgi:hypothetical protein
MRLINNTLKSVTFLLFLLFSTISIAQKDQTKLSKKAMKQHKSSYATKIKSLGMAIKPEAFYRDQIDINKTEQFKSIGLDLVELGNKAGELNYKEYTLVSDVILNGVIIGRTYHEDENLYFHTTYKIKVDTVLKGSHLVNDFVFVKTVSGSIGNDTFMNSSIDPDLYIGEKVLLMLSPIDVEGFENARKNGYFEKILNATTEDFFIYGKYTLKHNYYFDNTKGLIGEKKEVCKKIQQIQEINSSHNFYSKSFTK